MHFLLCALLAPQLSGSAPTNSVFVPAARPLPTSVPVAPKSVPLSSRIEAAYVDGLDVISLGAPRAEEIDPPSDEEEGCRDCGISEPTRVGFTRWLDEEQLEALDLAWTPHVAENDEVVWTAAVRSPGAEGLRLQLESVVLGTSSLSVWTSHRGEPLVRGPYEAQGLNGSESFWTPTLPGDTARLEVRGEERPTLRVTALAHFERLPGGAAIQSSGANDPGIGDSNSCQVDVECGGLTSGLQVARDATGQMNFMDSSGDWTLCSGTLVNDLDPSSDVLFFLTAYHCISTQSSASTLEVVWGYERPSCGGANPDWSLLPRNCGATLLETNPTSGGNDMCFLRLSGSVQPGVAFAGFTNAGTPEDTTLFGIHHPAGDLKKITFFENSWLFTCPFAWSEANYDYFEASLGLTEGGSSGSGLFNSSGILYGQLLGACCEAWLGVECEDANCGNQPDWRAVYGESAITWPYIQDWIETGGTIYVNASNTSPPWLGTVADPYVTVAQAVGGLYAGARVLFSAGSYDESAVITVQAELDSSGGSAVIGD